VLSEGVGDGCLQMTGPVYALSSPKSEWRHLWRTKSNASANHGQLVGHPAQSVDADQTAIEHNVVVYVYQHSEHRNRRPLQITATFPHVLQHVLNGQSTARSIVQVQSRVGYQSGTTYELRLLTIRPITSGQRKHNVAPSQPCSQYVVPVLACTIPCPRKPAKKPRTSSKHP
jgi:hypothetical protein